MPQRRFTNRLLFPDPRQADAEGLVAYGGDLHPQRVLAAYAQGIFPWPGGEDWPMLWYSPDPRMVLVPTENIRDVMAFPKTASAQDLMIDAPGEVDPKQLAELHLRIIK